MTASPHSIPVVHARKTAGGAVVAYSDEAMRTVAATWTHYATDLPNMRQRYLSINHQSHRVIWHK